MRTSTTSPAMATTRFTSTTGSSSLSARRRVKEGGGRPVASKKAAGGLKTAMSPRRGVPTNLENFSTATWSRTLSVGAIDEDGM